MCALKHMLFKMILKTICLDILIYLKNQLAGLWRINTGKLRNIKMDRFIKAIGLLDSKAPA